MAKAKFNNELARKILFGIAGAAAAGALIIALAAMPGLGLVIRELVSWYHEASPRDRYRIRKTFEALRRERLIKRQKLPDGTVKLVLSEKGEKKVLQYRFQDMRIPRAKQWDGKWRLVIFDIPKSYRYEREVWRHKLKALGFHQLQRSVWVHAFPCENEIDFVSEYLGISQFIRLVEADKFSSSEDLEETFLL